MTWCDDAGRDRAPATGQPRTNLRRRCRPRPRCRASRMTGTLPCRRACRLRPRSTCFGPARSMPRVRMRMCVHMCGRASARRESRAGAARELTEARGVGSFLMRARALEEAGQFGEHVQGGLTLQREQHVAYLLTGLDTLSAGVCARPPCASSVYRCALVAGRRDTTARAPRGCQHRDRFTASLSAHLSPGHRCERTRARTDARCATTRERTDARCAATHARTRSPSPRHPPPCVRTRVAGCIKAMAVLLDPALARHTQRAAQRGHAQPRRVLPRPLPGAHTARRAWNESVRARLACRTRARAQC